MEETALCLCWNCGRPIRDRSDIRMIDDEIWCPECAEHDAVFPTETEVD